MKEIIEQFAPIILHFTIHHEGVKGIKEVERCQIVFRNHSRLVVYQAVQGLKFKYSYQWMNKDNQTIYRWDNTPHFPQFATFPFHRHMGELEVAEPYEKVNLSDILLFISQQLTAM